MRAVSFVFKSKEFMSVSGRRFGSILRSTPKHDGYHMPAEWHQHSRVHMLWPYRCENWKEGARPVQKAFANVIKAISEFEDVTVGVSPTAWESALQQIGSIPRVEMKELEYDDVWMRDTGPTFLVSRNGKLGGIDWDFNCWGSLGGTFLGITYGVPFDKDKQIARRVLEGADVALSYKTEGFILEGGSIHVDGEGTILTTEECLLNKNRNPNLSKISIEKYLLSHLGAKRVLWIRRGLTADSDTNGHVDNICCFVAPGKVLLAWCDDPTDEQYHISREAYSFLQKTTDAKGREIEIVKMPIPPPMYYTEEDCSSLARIGGMFSPRTPGERLAASYVNFYLPNGNEIFSI